MRKADLWFLVGVALILLAILMFWGVVRAAPSYSNVGQNLTYVGMNESIELRAKWTPGPNYYDVSEGVYIDYLNVSAAGIPDGAAFNDDGTKFYTTIWTSADKFVYEYNLSTPYDISTGVYNDYLNITAQDTSPQGLAFNNNGTKLYVVGEGNDRVYEYNLSTPYDISTGVYNDYLNVSAQDTYPRGIAFNDDGTKLYVVGSANDKVYEYNLSTPYDISTGVYNDYLDVSAHGHPYGIAFNNNGTKLYVVHIYSVSQSFVCEYNLSVPYDISTGVYNDCLDVSAQDTVPLDLGFNNDGSKLYVVGTNTLCIYEYELRQKLDKAVLYVNLTGSYQAVDTVDLGDSKLATWSNFSYTPTTCNKVVGWKITANDSSATSNTTTIGTFYVMPYIYSGAGLNATCTNKHNATITPSTTGDINATFLAPYFVRNATFKECSYEITEDADRIKITNTSEYCNITVINLEAESGTSFYLQESTELRAYPPPNLPSTIAAAGLIIIVIYTITTRRRS